MGNTFDFDMMLSSAREAYGEELYKMACEGLDFVFTYSDNVAPSSSAGKLLREFPERCFNMGIAEPVRLARLPGLALAAARSSSQCSARSCLCARRIRSTRISRTTT